MPKLLFVLVAFLALGAVALQLRHQHLELRHRMATLHRDLQKSQATLWRQQLDIATYTSPQTLRNLVGASEDAALTIDAAAADAARE